MEGGRANSNDLQSLLEAIKASDVVENRVHLINQLGDMELSEISEMASLIDGLTSFWEDGTCLEISHCMLNKSILLVAAKFLETDTSGCLEQFITLGMKASEWCGKHLNVMVISIEESPEESRSSSYVQLVLIFLSFSAACFSALTKSPIMGQKVLRLLVEKFVFEQLKLTKATISEIKRIQSAASELLKAAQRVLDSATKLSKTYSDSLSLEICSTTTDDEGGYIDSEKIDSANHVINVIKCTVDHLCELGILAAGGGGSLVTILNVSWKGVVTLLHLGNGVLALKINVADIILILVSLITESLKSASESWSSELKEDIPAIEAKRAYLPVKFYLINAVRISSQYPCQAFTVYREITQCILMISTLGVSLSKDSHFRAPGEALTELLEPSLILLLLSLLNAADVKQESKLQLLGWLFTDEDPSISIHQEPFSHGATLIHEIFTVSVEAMPRTRLLMLGRVALFLNLLKSSSDLGEDIMVAISRKLEWLFDFLIDEDVYSSFLSLHIPVLYGSGTTHQLTCQSFFSFILNSLKTFIIVAFSSIAREVVECFMLENILHPHFLASEVIMELWCFVVRHGETEMVNDIIDNLCSLLKFVASPEQVFLSHSALRRMARSLCIVLTYAPNCIDRVYCIFNEDRTPVSLVMYISLLMEGFPLNMLSHSKVATQKIVTAYSGFVENIEKKHWVDNLSRSSTLCVVGAPVYALSHALSRLQIRNADIDAQTLKFVLSVINGYRSATDSLKDHYCELISQALGIISNLQHLYASGEMEEVVLELHSLFVTGSAASDTRLYNCKSNLSLFMAGVGHMEMVEDESSTTSTAVWELYHMLLRERHWAFAHLALASFGYFAARTSCNQLWRFVPPDAALSFNSETGSEANEERFMSELKAFLEKEIALQGVTSCLEQVGMLIEEGKTLKATIRRALCTDQEDSTSEIMEIDGENQASKKRKLPDEIAEGMSLLQNGSKLLGDSLALWRQQHGSAEWQEEFLIHFSHLEDAIASLSGLAGNS